MGTKAILCATSQMTGSATVVSNAMSRSSVYMQTFIDPDQEDYGCGNYGDSPVR